MKSLITLIFVATMTSFTFSQENNEYLVIDSNSRTANFYQANKYSYLDHYLDEKEEINGREYSIKVRKYSWGKNDTSYYRMDEINFLSYDKKSTRESVSLPRNPKPGDIWYEGDSSWVYQVLKDKQTFRTPAKKYKDCILVECKQLTSRDKHKSNVYYLYYSRGWGYVGNVTAEGEVLSYLKEKLFKAKESTNH